MKSELVSWCLKTLENCIVEKIHDIVPRRKIKSTTNNKKYWTIKEKNVFQIATWDSYQTF